MICIPVGARLRRPFQGRHPTLDILDLDSFGGVLEDRLRSAHLD